MENTNEPAKKESCPYCNDTGWQRIATDKAAAWGKCEECDAEPKGWPDEKELEDQ